MSNSNALDALLDSTLDDLADMPEFKPFPAGAHVCTLEFKPKEINKKAAVEVVLIHVSTEELVDSAATPPKPGDTTNCLFILTNNDGQPNEISQGKLKMILAALKETTGGTTNREVMEGAKGIHCLVVTKIRTNDKDKNNIMQNTDIVSLQVI